MRLLASNDKSFINSFSYYRCLTGLNKYINQQNRSVNLPIVQISTSLSDIRLYPQPHLKQRSSFSATYPKTVMFWKDLLGW